MEASISFESSCPEQSHDRVDDDIKSDIDQGPHLWFFPADLPDRNYQAWTPVVCGPAKNMAYEDDSSFYGLPIELRLRILSLAIGDRLTASTTASQQRPESSVIRSQWTIDNLLTVSKEIYEECLTAMAVMNITAVCRAPKHLTDLLNRSKHSWQVQSIELAFEIQDFAAFYGLHKVNIPNTYSGTQTYGSDAARSLRYLDLHELVIRIPRPKIYQDPSPHWVRSKHARALTSRCVNHGCHFKSVALIMEAALMYLPRCAVRVEGYVDPFQKIYIDERLAVFLAMPGYNKVCEADEEDRWEWYLHMRREEDLDDALDLHARGVFPCPLLDLAPGEDDQQEETDAVKKAILVAYYAWKGQEGPADVDDETKWRKLPKTCHCRPTCCERIRGGWYANPQPLS